MISIASIGDGRCKARYLGTGTSRAIRSKRSQRLLACFLSFHQAVNCTLCRFGLDSSIGDHNDQAGVKSQSLLKKTAHQRTTTFLLSINNTNRTNEFPGIPIPTDPPPPLGGLALVSARRIGLDV